jgi:hypothetical protein
MSKRPGAQAANQPTKIPYRKVIGATLIPRTVSTIWNNCKEQPRPFTDMLALP